MSTWRDLARWFPFQELFLQEFRAGFWPDLMIRISNGISLLLKGEAVVFVCIKVPNRKEIAQCG